MNEIVEICPNCPYCQVQMGNIKSLNNFKNCPACERFYRYNQNHYYSCLTPCPPPPSTQKPPKQNCCDLLPLVALFLLPWLNYNKPCKKTCKRHYDCKCYKIYKPVFKN